MQCRVRDEGNFWMFVGCDSSLQGRTIGLTNGCGNLVKVMTSPIEKSNLAHIGQYTLYTQIVYCSVAGVYGATQALKIYFSLPQLGVMS